MTCQECGAPLTKQVHDWICSNSECLQVDHGWAIFTGSGSDSPFRIDPHIERDDDLELFDDDDDAVIAALRLLQAGEAEWKNRPFTRAELAEALCNSINDLVFWAR